MLINEAIARADALLENEYTTEEKYHWCDVVGAELMASGKKVFKKADIMRAKDGFFLLPQDCCYDMIEKIMFRNREIHKLDMRRFGVHHKFLKGFYYIHFPRDIDKITVVYRVPYKNIRRYTIKDIIIQPSSANADTFKTTRDIPILPGDIITVTAGTDKSLIHIMERSATLTENDDMELTFTCGSGELISIPNKSAEISRIVTDHTVCMAPFDEMYIDYLCAQTAFFQRKFDVYQQFISRYNTRMKEYINFMKEYEAENDYTRFSCWW